MSHISRILHSLIGGGMIGGRNVNTGLKGKAGGNTKCIVSAAHSLGFYSQETASSIINIRYQLSNSNINKQNGLWLVLQFFVSSFVYINIFYKIKRDIFLYLYNNDT